MELNEQVWWYVARSGGIFAWVLITLSVCWGLFISTKATAKAAQPARVLDLHRFLGGLAVAFTMVHIVGLVADSYVYFGWSEVLVPFATDWKPGAVAWGILAFYLLLAVEISSLLMKHLPRRLWMGIHRLSFVVYVGSTLHGLQAGTDVLNDWYRIAMLASVNIVGFLSVVLILVHKRARDQKIAALASRSATSSGQAAADGAGEVAKV